MHQTQKGKQWYFGMKARIGVDAKTKRDPRGGGHASERSRQHDAAAVVARARDASMGPPGVSRADAGHPGRALQAHVI